MSYEGSIQYLCKNGHYYELDAGVFMGGFADDEGLKKQLACPTCGEQPAWENSVDDTNGDAVGLIDMEQFVSLTAKTCMCSCCGNVHVTEQTRYRIPTEKETKAAQTYWDGTSQTYKPLIDLEREYQKRVKGKKTKR